MQSAEEILAEHRISVHAIADKFLAKFIHEVSIKTKDSANKFFLDNEKSLSTEITESMINKIHAKGLHSEELALGIRSNCFDAVRL